MNLEQTAGVGDAGFTAMLPVIVLYALECVCGCVFGVGLRRGTARCFSQWRLSPALGRRVVRVHAVCENNLLVSCIISWLWTLRAFPYQLNLSRFLFPPTVHVDKQTVRVEQSVCIQLFKCCSQRKWMTYRACFPGSIVWGSSGSVLNAGGSSVNHTEPPHNNIPIVYLFSLLLCFHPLSAGGKRGCGRNREWVCTNLESWRCKEQRGSIVKRGPECPCYFGNLWESIFSQLGLFNLIFSVKSQEEHLNYYCVVAEIFLIKCCSTTFNRIQLDNGNSSELAGLAWLVLYFFRKTFVCTGF